jgi:redox-sensitive bicupin YhaK (pirin superfamily)
VAAVDLPSVEVDGARVRVVAGEVGDVSGPVQDIAAQPIYLDVSLSPGAAFVHPIPNGHTAAAYVFEGRGRFGGIAPDEGEALEAVKLAVFGDGDHVLAQADPDSPFRFMLFAGAPFGEVIVPYGPFVMNTEAEIQQALADLRNGTFVQTEA